MKHFAGLLIALLTVGWLAQALADPPAQAPAHGWRKKHDPHYLGYTGSKWEHDYDVRSGHCNREQIGAVLGAVVGGVIGSQVGSRDDRTVATIIGVALGALVGANIGRDMDDGDRACFGHALEIGAAGRRVSWDNGATGVRYELIPGIGHRDGARACRNFTLVASHDGEHWKRKGEACQNDRGIWRLK